MLLKTVVWLVGLTPLVWTSWRFFSGGLGANPVEALLHAQGRAALVLLILTLAVTPLRRLTGWNRIIKARRPLGLFSFFYASLHLSAYLVLDQGLAWRFILEDVLERPYITVGFGSFLLLAPLALTSTRGWIRRLGKRWQMLHRLVYPAAGLAVLHFYWKVKADTFWPLVAAGVLAVLLLVRLPWVRRFLREAFRRGPGTKGKAPPKSRASSKGRARGSARGGRVDPEVLPSAR